MSETNGNGLAVRETKANVPIVSGDFQIGDIEQGYRVAKFYLLAGMVPKGMESPEKVMLCVMYGQALGIPTALAVQNLSVINGRVAAFGDMVTALVNGSGTLESIRETITGEGDARACVVTMRRKNVDADFVGRFSVADAKKAGLWGKSGPWSQYPDRMLHWRAYSFAARDGFSDVLKGISVREEIEDYPATTATAQAPRVDEQLTEAVAALPTPAPSDEPPAELIFPGDAPEADDAFVKAAAAAMEEAEQEKKTKRK